MPIQQQPRFANQGKCGSRIQTARHRQTLHVRDQFRAGEFGHAPIGTHQALRLRRPVPAGTFFNRSPNSPASNSACAIKGAVASSLTPRRCAANSSACAAWDCRSSGRFAPARSEWRRLRLRCAAFRNWISAPRNHPSFQLMGALQIGTGRSRHPAAGTSAAIAAVNTAARVPFHILPFISSLLGRLRHLDSRGAENPCSARRS